MIETRSYQIRNGGGRIRVLRLTAAHGRCWWLRYIVERGESFCHRCGCTDEIGCVGGCGWVTAKHDLCSRCFERMLT